MPVVGPGAAIDARGGTTTRHISGWPVRVTIPAGAVSDSFALDIRPIDAEPGVLFAADFTPSPYQFATPIEVAFDECAVQSSPYVLPIAAHAATKVNGVWEPLPTERRGPCELVATVSHFSVIGLLPDGEYAEAFEQVGSFFEVGAAMEPRRARSSGKLGRAPRRRKRQDLRNECLGRRPARDPG